MIRVRNDVARSEREDAATNESNREKGSIQRSGKRSKKAWTETVKDPPAVVKHLRGYGNDCTVIQYTATCDYLAQGSGP